MSRVYTFLVFILLLGLGLSAQQDPALREKNIKKAPGIQDANTLACLSEEHCLRVLYQRDEKIQ